MKKVSLNNGSITLYNGDCLDIIPRKLEYRIIDLILADLPYGTTKCSWDSVIPLKALWTAYKDVSKLSTPFVLFAGEPFTSTLIQSNLAMFKYKWIWDKHVAGNFSTANIRPLNTFEEIVVFYRDQCLYNPQMVLRDNPISYNARKTATPRNRSGTKEVQHFDKEAVIYTHKHPTTVIDMQRPIGHKLLHPTQKPVELLEYLIRTYTNEGDLVLDNTMGVGSTGKACIRTNRRFIGIELDDTYFDIAVSEIENEL